MMTRRRPEGDYDDHLFSTGAPPRGEGGAPRAGTDAADDLKRAIEGLKEAAPGGIARLKQMIAREAFRKLGEFGLGDGEVPYDVAERIRRGEDAMSAVRGHIDGTLVGKFGPEFVFDAVISRPDLQERIRSTIRAERESREAEERERLRREAETRERERLERERRERAERERREAEARAEAEAGARLRAEVRTRLGESAAKASTYGLSLDPVNEAIRVRDMRRVDEMVVKLQNVIKIYDLLARDRDCKLEAYQRDFVQAIQDELRKYRLWTLIEDDFIKEINETYRDWIDLVIKEINATIAFVSTDKTKEYAGLDGVVTMMADLLEGVGAGRLDELEEKGGMQKLSEILGDMYTVVSEVEKNTGKRFVPPGGRAEATEPTEEEIAERAKILFENLEIAFPSDFDEAFKDAKRKEALWKQVQRAYRRKALRYHPDKNPGDKAAEERFKFYTGTYETLENLFGKKTKG